MPLDPAEDLRTAIDYAKEKSRDKFVCAVEHMESWLAEIERLRAPKHIWVASLDFGYEGHTPPIQAFLLEEDAFAAQRFLSAGAHNDIDVFVVPVWPQPATRWADQKPIAAEKST